MRSERGFGIVGILIIIGFIFLIGGVGLRYIQTPHPHISIPVQSETEQQTVPKNHFQTAPSHTAVTTPSSGTGSVASPAALQQNPPASSPTPSSSEKPLASNNAAKSSTTNFTPTSSLQATTQGQTQTQIQTSTLPVSTSTQSQVQQQPPTPQPAFAITVSGDYTRDVPGWSNRPYEMHIPAQYNGTVPLPVLLAIHGGGGNADTQVRLTCPGGNTGNSQCLNALADREGFIVIYPNGTEGGSIVPNSRTWNAGGGANGYACVSKYACTNNIDDISYFRALLGDVEKNVSTDTHRIYATGISNGAAMTHRLACQLSDQITAIASVAGENQFSAVSSCSPSRAIPVLEIHGTTDPAWPYAGGDILDLTPGTEGGGKAMTVADSIAGWVSRNGCNPTLSAQQLPDIAHDGTLVEHDTYMGCRNGAQVVLYRITNGGHTWPQGYQYLSEILIGKTTQQFNANEVIWDFFRQFSKWSSTALQLWHFLSLQRAKSAEALSFTLVVFGEGG